jgi:MtN3 and saliva related transmembrane protein
LDFATIIGFVAAFLTTFAFLPQSYKTIKTKQTKDLSFITLLMIEFGLVSWLIYGIMIASLPIIAANTVSILIMTIILILKIKYK